MVPELVLVGVVERSEQRVAGHGCLGGIADVNEVCLISPLSCSRPQPHIPGTALASSKEFKTHLEEAAKSQTPAKFTTAAKESHFQGPRDSQRCRQLAMECTVEFPVVGLELSLLELVQGFLLQVLCFG